jgi:hypothetical protein
MAGGYVQPTPDAVAALVGRIENLTGRVEELERPTGSQLAQTLVSTETSTVSWTTGDHDLAYLTSDASINLVLRAAGTVRVTYVATINAQFTNGTVGNSFSQYAGRVGINGVGQPRASVFEVGAPSGGAGPSGYYNGMFLIDQTFALASGSYTFTQQYTRWGSGGAGGGTAAGSRRNGQLTVQVIA